MELLVAIAIFVTVMASVALVFNGAIRTSKQGFQNQEAYELARGAMKVIERDLSRAFTNRNHGDVFNFYGTPIGFTYVGLISADESSAPNMARVTYVVYHDQFNALAGSVATYQSKDGVDIPTYQLLRFVEPGADTLDSFPLDWSLTVDLDSGSPATFDDLVRGTVQAQGCPDQACRDLMTQAARREIWIKMLAGGGDAMTGVDINGNISGTVILPSAWSLPVDYLGFPPFPQSQYQSGVVLNFEAERALVADYAIAESIRFLSLASTTSSSVLFCAATYDALNTQVENENGGVGIDFDDVIYQNGDDICVRVVSSTNDAPMFYDDILANAQFSRALFSATDGPRPFFTYWDVGVRPQLTDPNDPFFSDPANVITANDKIGPIAFQFWNDWRNLLEDGLDNDNDGTIDEIDERYAENAGSPLDTRLPVAVTADFTLFFRSPYPGAPDFNERFTQRIDLPTAYRRSFKQRVPETP